VDDPMAALKLALTEIPADCSLARALNWAFEAASDIRNYRDAHDALSERFPSLNRVHTINNACLTLFGIHLGGTDLSKVIGETVAMGYDNDCTAATAGSIVGAVIGRDSLESKWVEPFGDRMYSYLKGKPEFSINDLLSRFEAQFRRLSAT
jgi:ADP-ribosylglycohydrolase